MAERTKATVSKTHRGVPDSNPELLEAPTGIQQLLSVQYGFPTGQLELSGLGAPLSPRSPASIVLGRGVPATRIREVRASVTVL